MLTDKAYAKSIAETRLPAEFVIPTLWLGSELPEIAPCPMPFVVKSNHGCNQIVIVRTDADYARARKLAPGWLKEAYGAWLDEWHYGAARRLILVEPYIGGAKLPLDYKVYVFGGRAEMIQVHTGREDRHRWSQFDRNWKLLSDGPVDLPPPYCVAELIKAAEQMGREHEFVRVDFYCEGDALLFGEYCLFPGSGLDPFRSDLLDLGLGKQWATAWER